MLLSRQVATVPASVFTSHSCAPHYHLNSGGLESPQQSLASSGGIKSTEAGEFPLSFPPLQMSTGPSGWLTGERGTGVQEWARGGATTEVGSEHFLRSVVPKAEGPKPRRTSGPPQPVGKKRGFSGSIWALGPEPGLGCKPRKVRTSYGAVKGPQGGDDSI